MRRKSPQVNVAQAKKSLSELLGRVAYGKEMITIVKRGRPMARLVPVPPEDSATLADVKGWLEDDHPFFKNIDQIVAARHRRRPRRPPPLAG
jgi:prevent-host-death family protein